MDQIGQNQRRLSVSSSSPGTSPVRRQTTLFGRVRQVAAPVPEAKSAVSDYILFIGVSLSERTLKIGHHFVKSNGLECNDNF